MALVITPIRRSALLDGYENGRLPESILIDTPGLAGGAVVTLIEPAARAWRALTDVAGHRGHILKTSGPYLSYRPYAEQRRIFLDRYRPYPIAGSTDRKWWDGRWWWKRHGVASAAPPGRSNHGWAGAVDGREATGPFDPATMSWLLAVAGRFGWSWELESEPWHLVYFAGDAIPRAVLEWEAAHQPSPDPDPPEDDDVKHLVKATSGELKGRWYIVDGIWRRHVTSRDDAAVQVGSGLCTADGIDDKGHPIPHDWPAYAVEGLKDA